MFTAVPEFWRRADTGIGPSLQCNWDMSPQEPPGCGYAVGTPPTVPRRADQDGPCEGVREEVGGDARIGETGSGGVARRAVSTKADRGYLSWPERGTGVAVRWDPGVGKVGADDRGGWGNRGHVDGKNGYDDNNATVENVGYIPSRPTQRRSTFESRGRRDSGLGGSEHSAACQRGCAEQEQEGARGAVCFTWNSSVNI